MDDDFKVLRDFADGQTDGRTNERTNRQTFVIVESLSRLKNMTHFKFKLGVTSKKKSLFKDNIQIKVDHPPSYPIFDKLFFDKF